ncbi:hypothetical protein B9N43_08330 [Denitratisoma sp. DHT3]|uniref:AraC family transcriptional regulator n=1 Tax=Denitratisoma sp. DHT3 TaxID=1981880 RepID=UPI0011986369|nr:AraC family transcriptional regulator [Denitratisoma sp. DHT3]QDX81246.1 hypothetical protein B9N43_08330 [Denitratisoma sp. DHT3]
MILVSMNYVAWLADFMLAHDVSPAQLLAGTGIEERNLAEPAAEISDEQHVALLRNARRLSRDPALGLELGIHRHISTLDRFGFAMMCCETFREALRVGNEYQRVIGRFSGRLLFLSLHEEARNATFQIEVAPELGDLAQFAVEEILGSILSNTRSVTGRDLPVRELCCAYPQPAHAASYRKYFSCPIRFDAPRNQIRFDAAFLDTRLPLASSHAALMYRTHCERLVGRDSGDPEGLVAGIRARLLAGADCALPLEACAEALSISARTLRRKLHEGGHSYQDIVDDVRASLARSYLESSRLTVEAIAERLGFSEPTSFSRAFRRWTGMSPRTFRNRPSEEH